ncbi:MAG TPA: hypothetical protein VFL10_07800 [Ornithinibacter sp.]|nr:hypothetical protein [Ornithinibacter sp.]
MRKHARWIVGLTIVGTTLAPAGAAAEASPFAGTWTSIDTDGSNQTMKISGSTKGALGVRYFDDVATVCGGDPARFAGTGRVDGDVLVADVLLVCIPGGNVFGHITIEATYDASTDTLSDPSGVVWTRQ